MPVNQRKGFNYWYITIVAIFVLILILSLRKIYDTDIGFHLRGGEWMLENKSFHHFDVFTYTVRNNEYIAMYWMFQIILYLLYKLGGDGLISIFNSIILLVFFVLVFYRLRRSAVPLWLCAISLFACILPIEIRFGVRPEIFTYLFLVLVLLVLDDYFYRRSKRLYLLPMIMLAWVNFHGLYILGFIAIGCYLISTYVHQRPQFKGLLKWSVLSLIVTLINPYFLKGWSFPFYLFTRLQSHSIFKDAITEFASPFSLRGYLLTHHLALYIYYIFNLFSIGVSIATFNRRKIHELLLLILFGYVSLTAVRNIPLFTIIAIQIVALGIRDLMEQVDRLKKFFSKLEFTLAIGILIIAVSFALQVKNNHYYARRGGGSFGVGFDSLVHPIKACEFLKKHNINGRILNDLNRGSWLIWSTHLPVFIDGRLEVMREEFFREFHESHSPGGINELIAKYNPVVIFFDYSYPEALYWDIDLENNSDWRIIYWDETSIIYARNDYKPELQSISLLSALKQILVDTTISDNEAWQILTSPTKSLTALFFEGLVKSTCYPTGILRMAFYASVKLDFQTAEILYLNALKKADYNRGEIYFRLALIYHFTGAFEKAEYCYKRVLQEKPGHKKTQEMLSKLRKGLLPHN